MEAGRVSICKFKLCGRLSQAKNCKIHSMIFCISRVNGVFFAMRLHLPIITKMKRRHKWQFQVHECLSCTYMKFLQYKKLCVGIIWESFRNILCSYFSYYCGNIRQNSLYYVPAHRFWYTLNQACTAYDPRKLFVRPSRAFSIIENVLDRKLIIVVPEFFPIYSYNEIYTSKWNRFCARGKCMLVFWPPSYLCCASLPLIFILAAAFPNWCTCNLLLWNNFILH